MANGTVKRNQSVERVLDIIEIMAKYGEPIRLNDLSEILEMSPTTVYRFLQTLMDRGYVRKEEETTKYYLSLRLKYYSEMIMNNYNLSKIVYPFLKQLAQETGESASLVIMEDNMAVYIDKCDGSKSMLKTLQRIGNRAPLYCTGVGKVFLADLAPEQRNEAIENGGPLEPLTVHTITSIDKLEEELEQINASGVSYDNEECEIGAKCVAVPLRDYTGKVIAAMSVSGPTSRMAEENLESIKQKLIEIGKQVSDVLGFVE